MKLRTEMLFPSDHKPYVFYGYRKDVRRLMHDAACAHALMQAMDEAGDVVFYADDDYQHWVYDRADEIMAGWGFDSGEAQPE
jgi:hypothetical protein